MRYGWPVRMSERIFGCIVLVSIFLPNASLGQAVHTGEFTLEDVIPAGDVEIEFLDIRMSTRGQELAAKMQAALASKKAWWLNYVKDVLRAWGATTLPCQHWLDEKRVR